MEVQEALGLMIIVYITYRILDYIYRMPRVLGADKTVFITGCDSGFGFEAARRFDSYGMQVFAGCFTEKGAETLKSQCSQHLKTIRLDVTDLDDIKNAYDMVKKEIPHGKGLWGLINNAGCISKVGPEDWLSQKDYEEVLNVNLHGLISTTMTFLPLIKQAKGRIINVSSVAGRHNAALFTPYCISKYGVECFSDGIRRSLKPYGISVHIIEPGFHGTPLLDTILPKLDQAWQECPAEVKMDYGEDYVTAAKDHIKHILEGPITTKTTTDVIDAFDHAMLAKFPRARYVVGLAGRFVFVPISQLPESIGDWLFKTIGEKM